MEQAETPEAAPQAALASKEELFAGQEFAHHQRTDRLFGQLMILQWLAGIAAAALISPRTWIGSASRPHLHLLAAIVLGAIICVVPASLAYWRAGERTTRYAIALGQALMSALLIHLFGGRIETHFHIFGSLAFLAFYRDPSVLVLASAVVAADHFLRGIYYPRSVYGIAETEWWRWIEHAGWVLFEDIFLLVGIHGSRKEMMALAEREASLGALYHSIEHKVIEKTEELKNNEIALRDALKAAEDLAQMERAKHEALESMQQAVEALSTPVLKVWQGVLALPLIGFVDERRADLVTLRLLEEVANSSASYVILDVTGVVDIDDATTNRLLKVTAAVELLGAQCFLTGMRPALARSVVSLGGSFGAIRTLPTLEQALRVCIKDRKARGVGA